LSLGELAPELRLVPPNLGRDTQKLDDHRAVEKIRPCRAKFGDGVEHQRTSGIEDGLIMVAIKLPAAEAAAGRQTTGSTGLWQAA